MYGLLLADGKAWQIIVPALELFALWLLAFGGIGAALGKSKGLAVDGFVYGSLLGPFGWLIVLLKHATPKAEARREREIEDARRQLKGR